MLTAILAWAWAISQEKTDWINWEETARIENKTQIGKKNTSGKTWRRRSDGSWHTSNKCTEEFEVGTRK